MNLLLAYVGSPRFRKAMRSKPGQKGFSLIELIIAVAVIAILSAAVLPQFASQSTKAANATAQDIIGNAVKECSAGMAEKNVKSSGVTTKLINNPATDGMVKGYKITGSSTTASTSDCDTNFSALATVKEADSGLFSYCYIHDSATDSWSFTKSSAVTCP